MMGIKKFICGLCKGERGERYVGTRHGLRKHLREVHRIMSGIANSSGEKKTKRRWWIVKDAS